jgi:hypothetical protein
MPYPITRRSVLYLGNRSTREVHELRDEQTNCRIGEIIAAGNAIGFDPDTLEQANVEGYDNCHYCIGGSTR